MKKALPVLILSFLILSALFMLFLQGCTKAAENYNFTDSYGRRLDLDLPAGRIISAAPNITECFFALGLQDRLVGRTDYCTWPPEALRIKSIGEIMEPGIETILMLRPDLIIASSHFKKSVVETLTADGIPTVALKEEDSFDGLYSALDKIAFLAGKPDRSKKLIARLRASVQEILDKLEGVSRPRVYYVVGFGDWGDFTAGGDTFISEMITMAGGDNVAADVKGWSFNLESLMMRDPDILVCPDDPGMKESLEKANGYRDLSAVREHRVYTINRDLVELQGPRIVDGLKRLAEIIHPEIFPGNSRTEDENGQ